MIEDKETKEYQETQVDKYFRLFDNGEIDYNLETDKMNSEIKELAKRILNGIDVVDIDDAIELAELVLDFEPDPCEREHVK